MCLLTLTITLPCLLQQVIFSVDIDETLCATNDPCAKSLIYWQVAEAFKNVGVLKGYDVQHYPA